MYHILTHIEFDHRRVWIDAPGEEAAGAIDRLDGFLGLCRARGLTDIRLCQSTQPSTLSRRAQAALASRHGARLTRLRAEPVPASGNELTADMDEGEAIVFRIDLAGRSSAVENVTTAMILVAAAANLDDSAGNQLRFCAYELAMNSMEHGDFAGEAEIRAEVRLRGGELRFEYRDNADRFVTENAARIDIDRKIATRDKRGLGLYILNRLGRSLEYRRVDGWNVTTLDMTVGYKSASTPWRNRMDGISIDVKACGHEETAVLKPTGSIDSSTAGEVETCVNGAIEQGNRFIVVDLENVDFVSSAGVGIFLGTVSILRASGGDLIFMNVPRHVEEVFDIINLKSYFRTIESLEKVGTLEPR